MTRKSYRQRLKLAYAGRFGPVPKPRTWAFLVGCYNSGTTLLNKVLGTHPDIATFPNEGQFFQDVLPVPQELGLPRLWAKKPELFCLGRGDGARLNVRRLRRQWGTVINDLSRPVVLEKSPTNAARILWLEENFVDARFIGIVRNGYAVAEGIRRKAGHDIRDCAEQWMVSNQIMLRDLDKAKQSLQISYEELSESPNETLARVFDFLGVDNACLSQDGTRWKIHEQDATLQNMNPRSIAGLSADDIREVENVAGELLLALSYRPS